MVSFYCNFDAAAAAVDNLIEEIVREQYGDMPRGELETVKEFVFRDFMHFLAARAGIYTWKKFSESRARQRLCVYIEKNWGRIWDLAREWFVWWRLKWNQRVKLVFSEEEFHKAAQAQKWSNNLEEALRAINTADLRLFVINHLIIAGEVAGVEQIAEYLIRDEINALVSKKGVEAVAEYYKSGRLTERLLTRIYSLKRVSDPLLLLKFDFGRPP